MKYAAIALAISAFAAGLVAAWYWYRSTQVPTKNAKPNARGFDTAAFGLAWGIFEASNAIAAFNKKAAAWTAVATLLSAMASVLGNFSN